MKIKNTRAFTFVELLVVAAVIGFVLSVILTAFTTTVALNESSRNLTTASTHGEYILESIRNATFSTVASSITAGTWDLNAAAISAAGMTALNTETIVTTYAGSNPLTVTVTVNWKDIKGRSRAHSISTLVTG